MATPTRETSTQRAPEPGSSRIAKPDYYYGDRNKLDDWINQTGLYFRLEGIPDNRRSLIASSYLRGEAQQWIRPKLTELLTKNRDSTGIFGDFDNFIEELRSIYGLSNEKQVAIRNIQHVTQRTSASQYTAKFKEYATLTGWNDSALVTMYYTGLKDNVKDELMRSGADQTTLANMTRAAIEIDDRLYERAMEKRYTGQQRGRTGLIPTSGTGRYQRRDPDAMELDATQRAPRKGNRGRNRGKSKPLGERKTEGPECYSCHKKGHFARDCRGLKVRPQQRQINAMIRQENEPPTDKVRNEKTYETDKTGWNLPAPFLAKPDPIYGPGFARCPPFEWNARTGRNEWVSDDYARLEEMDRASWPMTRAEREKLEEHRQSIVRSEQQPTMELNIIEGAPKERGERWTPEEQLDRIEEDLDELYDERQQLQATINRIRPRWRALENAWNAGDQRVYAPRIATENLLRDLYHQAQEQQRRLYELLDERARVHRRIRTSRQQREFNIMESQPPQQERDDGHHTRGRSPPPFRWEENNLHQETQSSQRETTGESEQEQPISRQTLEEEGIPETQEAMSELTQANNEALETIAETDNSDVLNDSTPEISDSEDTDDEKPDDVELLVTTVEAPAPVIKMILHAVRESAKIFPNIHGKRRLDTLEFDKMLGQFRAMFWDYRLVDREYHTHSYVSEIVPIGSTFPMSDETYATPDGMIVPKTMRERVRLLDQRYQQIMTYQHQYQEDTLTFGEMQRKCTEHMRQWSIPPLMPPGSPLPIWRGTTLGHRTTTRGSIQTRMTQGKVVFTPREGPLSWEISIEDANSPDYYSKNE